MSEYLKIFSSFFKIGLFTFGGGYAMFPMFRKELIEKHRYITEEELMDYYSIGQCTPGIIAINVATFTGYKIKRTKGACLATFAIVIPSLLIIMLLAGILGIVSDNEIVNHAFSGIRIGVTVLIFNELVNLMKKNVKNKYQIVLFICAVVLLLLFNLSSILAVLLAASVGAVRYWRLK